MRARQTHDRYASLTWLIVAMTVAALVIGAIAARYVENRLVASKGESLSLAASEIAHKLDLLLQERYDEVLALARAEVFQKSDTAAKSAHLATLKKTHHIYLWVGVTDAQGRIAIATDPATIGRDLGRSPWFQAARDTGHVHVGDVEPFEEAGGIDAISFTAPIEGAGGKFQGVVTTRVGLPLLEDVVARTLRTFQRGDGLGGSLEYKFATARGDVFVDSDLPYKGNVNLKRLGVPSALLSESGSPGYVEEEHLHRHIRVVTGYARTNGAGEFPGLKWTVLLHTDKDDLVAPIRSVLWKLAAAWVLVWLPMFGFLIWSSTRLKQEWAHAQNEHAHALTAESNYRQLVDQARDIIYRTDEQGRFTFVNPIVTRIMGYSPQELLGRRFIELIRPDARAAAERFYGWQFVRKTPGTYYEFPAMNKDGREIWIGQNVQVLLENGRVAGFHAVARDITERKQTEEALRANEQRIRAILDGALDAVVGMDEQGVITDWNPQAETIFGWSRSKATGQNLAETIIPPRYREQHYHGMKHFLATGEGPLLNRRIEITALRRDGTEFPVELTVSCSMQGDSRRFTAFIADITARKQAEEALRASEAFKNRILESSPDCIKILDLEGRMLFMNKGGQELMEIHDIAPLLNSQWLEFWNGEDKERVRAAVESARTGNAGRFIGFCTTASGKPKWWDVSITPLLDASGAPERLLSISRDITERKQIEEALRESETLMRLFMEATSDCIWNWDLATAHVARNTGFERLFGYTAEEIVPTIDWWAERLHPDDRERVWATYENAVADGRTVCVYEYRFRLRDGSYAVVSDHVFIVRDGTGKVVRALGAMTDITERKRTEEALQQSEERFRSAFGHAAIGMALVSTDGRWLQVNPALCDIVGYSEPELLATTFQAITHPDDLDTDLAYVRQMLAGEIRYYQMEKRYIHKRGHSVWILLSVSLVRDAQGNPLHFISLIKDITERKQAEEALRERANLSSVSAEVGLALNRDLPMDEMLRQCTEATVRHLGAALTRIWIVGPGDLCQDCFKAAWCADRAQCLHLVASAGLSTNLDGEYRRVPLGALKIGRIAQGMGIMVTNDVLDDERLPNKDWLRENGLQSFAGFPLIIEGKVFGVLAMFAKTPLSEPTIQALESICNGIAAAIARKRAEQGLHERSRQQAIEAELSLLAVTTPDLLTLLNTAAGLAANALQVDYCEVLELFSNGSELRLRASAGWKSDHIGQVRAMEIGSLAHATLHSNKPVIIQNLLADARFGGPPWLHKHEAVGGMSVSITGKESPWGVLGVYTAGTRAFSRDDINFLQTVSSILATAIERTQAESVLRNANQALRLLSRQLLQVQEDDRRAIARDLHDEIGQSLTAIKLNVERAQRTSDRDARARIMQDCVQITERVLGQVRDLSLDLHPSILDDLGLAHALKWHADRQAERAGLKVEVTADPSLPRLSQDIEIACFRIAQEALTNVMRHAQARHTGITLKRGTASVELCIQDDGIGFIVDKAFSPASVGLASMRERAKLLGGTVMITSAPRCGTKVIATLPLLVASPAGMPTEEVPRS